MESSIYRFIFRYSLRQQIALLLLTAVSFPFLYLSLDLPKQIVNQAIGGRGFPKEVALGPLDLTVTLDQVSYLMLLCGMFLALVLVNGGFKYWINVAKGRLGERMLRRLRYELYCRVLRFPPGHFRKVSQGEIIPMVTSEVEPLGGFIGDALAQPAFQGGTLLTIVVFMFFQDWVLGLAAVSLYPIQAYFIPKMQRKVNQLGKERVRTVRRLADRIGATISGVEEVHANDASRYERADFSERLGTIYRIRFEIYQRKFMIKFLNNFINQLTPFFFYSIGGYLVIAGDLTFGALVAVLAAYKDLASPWKELLDYYQQSQDAKIKYDQVVEQFDPPGMLDLALLDGAPTERPLQGELVAANVTRVEEDGRKELDSVSFNFRLDQHVAILGQGREELARVLARLVQPESGRVAIAGEDLARMPEAVTGRRIAYVGPGAFIFAATVRDNLFFGVRHQPLRPAAYDEASARERRAALLEAGYAANSAEDLRADWNDYAAAGAVDHATLIEHAIDALELVDLADDVYEFGLRLTIDPKARPELAARALEARERLRTNLAAGGLGQLVEPFDPDRFNGNASLAENLLFGTAFGREFAPENLVRHEYVQSILEKAGLIEPLYVAGVEVARTMVELFKDLAPGHELFERFAFISADDLPNLQALVQRADRDGAAGLDLAARQQLMSLPMRLIPARHRLGVIDAAMQERVVRARQMFARELPASLKRAVEIFDPAHYNAAATLLDNILFGKVAYGQAQAEERVVERLEQVTSELGLRRSIIEVGLDFACGVAGSRLTHAQRQRLALARVLLRRPDMLVLNDATLALDSAGQDKLLAKIREARAGKSLVWSMQRASMANGFDRVLVLQQGRLAASGRFDDVQSTANRPGRDRPDGRSEPLPAGD
jgi:putative ABC transport system ATP-binding protein